MVTPVFVQPGLHRAVHVARPCGDEDESSELWAAQMKQSPSPSRSLAAVVLGASASKYQPAFGTLPPSPSQSGSQKSQ
eukprot:scaffold31831_cov49-Phaeocystis_antarctica.AAC.3